MSDIEKNKGKLKCEFDQKAGSAALLDAKGNVIASGPFLTKPILDAPFGVNNHYEGDSVNRAMVTETGNKSLDAYNFATATKSDGFNVVVEKKSAADKNDGYCNVELVGGDKFERVPMVKVPGPGGR